MQGECPICYKTEVNLLPDLVWINLCLECKQWKLGRTLKEATERRLDNHKRVHGCACQLMAGNYELEHDCK